MPSALSAQLAAALLAASPSTNTERPEATGAASDTRDTSRGAREPLPDACNALLSGGLAADAAAGQKVEDDRRVVLRPVALKQLRGSPDPDCLAHELQPKKCMAPPGGWRLEEVKPSAIYTSSELKERSGRHPGAHAFDGRLDTAWLEGVPGLGVGEALMIELSPARGFDVLAVAPGYARPNAYQASARPTRLALVTLPDTPEAPELTCQLDRNDSPTHLFLDLNETATPELQYFDLRELWLNDQTAARLRFIAWVIATASPGSRYQDTGLSEIRLLRLARDPTDSPF